MGLRPKSIGRLVLRLIVGLALLGWPRLGFTQGTWSVIPVPQQPSDAAPDGPLAVDAAGDLFISGPFLNEDGSQIQDQIRKRDTKGNWSIIDDAVAHPQPSALTTDTAGNLYVGGYFEDVVGIIYASRIQRYDPQGNWTDIALQGSEIGQVLAPHSFAVDSAGALYVADLAGLTPGRIQERDAQGNWSVIAPDGDAPGQVVFPIALAADAAGNLYAVDSHGIQKRDAQGNWSLVVSGGDNVGEVDGVTGLAIDTSGNLYVAESYGDPLSYLGSYPEGARVQKRDANGNWTVIATHGKEVGQVRSPSGLAVDGAGHLYVADSGNNRLQMYTSGR